MSYPNISHAQASAVLAAIPFAGASIWQRADAASSITAMGGTISATGGPGLATVAIVAGGPAGTATFTLTPPGGVASAVLPTSSTVPVAVGGYTLTFSGNLVAGEQVQLLPPNAMAPRFKVVSAVGTQFFLSDTGQPVAGYAAPPAPSLPAGLNPNGSIPVDNFPALIAAAQQVVGGAPVIADSTYRLVNNGSGWLVPLT